MFLLLLFVEVLRNAFNHLSGRTAPHAISAASFVVMLVTVGVNLFVVSYESREAERLGSEVLLADAIQTRGDVWSSLTVIVALAGARLGWPILDPLAALVVAGFIGWAGYQIATATTRILSDRMVIAESDLEAGGAERAGRARVPSDPHARLERSRVSRSPRLAAAGHASDGRPRAVARREGPADGAISADRRRDHPHRAAAAGTHVKFGHLVIWLSGH